MLVLGLWGVVVLLLVLIAVGAARGENRASGHRRGCTHGVSSVGPVEIANGKVVGGSTTPTTEACLP